MRLFVAIELDDAIRTVASKVQASLKRSCDGVRWVQPELLHLTVKFLGEVLDPNVVSICEALNRAAEASEPFELEASACGCFPERGPVRVIWIGGRECSPAMLTCVSAVERELEALGVPRERRGFSPHLTLSRLPDDRSRGKIREVVQATKVSAVSQEVSSIVLMSSVLSRGGPTYAVVSRSELGKYPSIPKRGQE